MNEIEKWEESRKMLRQLFSELDMLQILDVGKDLAVMLEYRSKQVNSMLDHQEFSEMMKKEWPITCDGQESSG